MSRRDSPFLPCSSFLISWATGSGKTQWVYRFLKNMGQMFPTGQKPKAVLYCYGIYQTLFDDMTNDIPNIRFHEGLPSQKTLEHLAQTGKNSLLILDDLMSEVSGNAATELFTRGTHHLQISVIYIVQNLLYQNKHARTISLNTQYMILFRNIRDASQISYLARQMHPRRPAVLMDAYEDATSTPFGYLVIDMHPQSTDERQRLNTGIFPREERTYYQPAL